MAENRTPPAGDRPMVQMGPRRGGPGGPMVREKPKNMKKTLGKLFKYIGKSKYFLVSLLVIVCFIAALTLAGPALQAEAISAMTIEHGQLEVDFQKLITAVILMAIVYALSSLFTYLQGILAYRLYTYPQTIKFYL